jgi:hypothetical protein
MNNSTYQSGGWDKFVDTGIEEETFVTLLQSAGYETAMVGKYMNQYSGQAAASHKPAGFDHWMALMTYGFYGCTFSDNGEGKFELNKTVYQTDYIRDWAIDFLKNKRDPTKPFFLMITPFAPHAPATPAVRHKDMFQDVNFPQYDSFNPSNDIQQQHAGWIKGMPLLTQEQIDDMNRFYRRRLRSLQAVDEALELLVNMLVDLDLDNNTYTFYTSDNGQHFGDFRMPAGKHQAYETDVLVPFLVRGPGIQPGKTSTEVIQSVDLGPTFLDIATAKKKTHHGFPSSKTDQQILRASYPMDGKSILPLLNGEITVALINQFRWAALIEMFGGSSGVGKRYENHPNYLNNHMYPNTYQAIRIINGPFEDWSVNSNWLYVEWCTGEIEFYNVTNDPHQTKNLAVSSLVAGSKGDVEDGDDVDLIPLFRRLSHLLSKLGTCSGVECHQFHQRDHTWEQKFLVHESKQNRTGVQLLLHELQALIRTNNRLRCYNPYNVATTTSTTATTNTTTTTTTTTQRRRENNNNFMKNKNLGRKPFAYDLFVPEPFEHGFIFSDEEEISETLLDVWEKYRHYFN